MKKKETSMQIRCNKKQKVQAVKNMKSEGFSNFSEWGRVKLCQKPKK